MSRKRYFRNLLDNNGLICSDQYISVNSFNTQISQINLIKGNNDKFTRPTNYYEEKKNDKLENAKFQKMPSKTEHTFTIFCASRPCRPLEIAWQYLIETELVKGKKNNI